MMNDGDHTMPTDDKEITALIVIDAHLTGEVPRGSHYE